MRVRRNLLCAVALLVLGSMSQVASACVATYTDSSVDAGQSEVHAWAWVEDTFNTGYCFQAAFAQWSAWSHTYHASVQIESPTQNSVSNVGGQSNVSFGGGSASAFAAISFVGDPGEYKIDWVLWIWCTVGQLFFHDSDSGTEEVEGPPPPVHVEYTMFIPLSHVRSPPPFSGFEGTIFSGDNQPTYIHGSMFPYNSTYRIRQAFVINAASKTVENHDRQSGLTLEYTPASQSLSTTPSCYRKFCPNCPKYGGVQSIVHDGYCLVQGSPSCIGEADGMPSITAAVTISSSTSVTVQFTGNPSNTCEALAPGIDWANTLTISWTGGQSTYNLAMAHDGFPMHEVRVNGVLVYDHDPVLTGHTPLALVPWQGNVNPPPLSGPLP